MKQELNDDRDPNTVDWIELAAQGGGPAAKAAKLEKRALARSRAQASGQPPAPAADAVPDALAVPDKPRARAEVIRLPTWVEAVRGVPNMALRSALFGGHPPGAAALPGA